MQKVIAISGVTLFVFLTSLFMACSERQAADLIVRNAKIYTVDSHFSQLGCMAIAKGRIVGIGSEAEINSRFTSGDVLDAGGKFIYPGFIDAHCHFLGYGLTLSKASLSGAKSWEEVVDRLVEHQKQFPTEWVEGRGWNQNEWDVREFPTNELLNKAFPTKPVLIIRVDGHAAIANSFALRKAQVNEKSKVNGGELIIRDGKLTGVLIDNAIDLVRRVIPAVSAETKAKALLKAQENCFAVGLTSVSDAGLDCDEVQLIDSMHRAGKLKMRIYAMLNPTPANFETFVSKGIYLTDYLTVRSIKLFADGALGARGALLLEPYTDSPNSKGLQMEKYEYYDDICRRAIAANYQVCTHCIGDGAVRLMLDVYSGHLAESNDCRWRIEHSQIVHPADLPRYGQCRIVPSIQTTHATSDMEWADERLGDRIKYAYAYQDLLRQNGWLPNGSDFPVEHINPIYGFYSGVARKNFNGNPPDGFQMENALTREQALRAMTIWAAKSSFEEDVKGSLEVGKFADFVILNEDLMDTPEESLFKVKVLGTYIAGSEVFSCNN